MNATDATRGDPAAERLRDLRTQRTAAFACAWLSLSVSGAILLSSFVGYDSKLRRVQEGILIHQRMVTTEIADFKANAVALAEVRAALDSARRAAAPSHP